MTLKESYLRGLIPADLKIFDAHAHVGEGEYSQAFIYTLPLDESIRLSRKYGIAGMAASSMKALSGNVREGNRRLFEMIDAHPEYVYGYVYYSPANEAESFESILQYRDHPNFIGVKIHPRECKCPLTEGGYEKLWKYAVKNDILILCHTWETECENRAADFGPILKAYPGLRLLLGHMGGTRNGVVESCRLAEKYPNVYLDINGSLYSETWIEVLASKTDTTKLIFSTDQTFNDPRIIMGRVLFSDIRDDLKRDILYYNFRKMTGRKYV